MAPLLCIRHAQSTMNAAGLWQGQADPPLSAEGVRQARALGAALLAKALKLSALVSSDLQRASQTAVIVGEALGLVPEPAPGLREMDVGLWSGRTPAEIAARWPEDYARFRAGDDGLRPGGGESRSMLRARVRKVFRELSAQGSGPLLGVVTHLGVLRSLRPGLQLQNGGALWLGSEGASRSAAWPAPAGLAIWEPR